MSTPNMGLAQSTVGSTTGPTWANNLNANFNIIDQHDHTSGNGAQLTPSSLNINAALTLQNNSLTNAKTLELFTQGSTPSSVKALYTNGTDLFYIDGSSNNIRITQSGAVAGTPGSISNLVSPASASYVSLSTIFVFQSASNTAANLDGASFILRNLTASSKGLTLSPPNAMAADYTLVLPALPASQKIMTLDASGNITAPYSIDNSTLDISSNIIEVKAGGINTPQLADGGVTNTKRAALGQQISSSSGAATTSTNFFSDITNLSISITTSGRPVYVGLIPDGSSPASIGAGTSAGGAVNLDSIFQLVRGSTAIATAEVQGVGAPAGSTTLTLFIAPGALWTIDTPAAGTYTYKAQFKYSGEAGGSAAANHCRLIAYEL